MRANVVDSSAWLEYFADTPNADYFARPIEQVDRLLVPTICLLEVFRTTQRQRGRYEAYRAVAQMRMGRVIGLDHALAIAAARISLSYRLATADSIVYACARSEGAVLWTQDADFESLPMVKYKAKR